jgi:hypothetical protein
VILALLLAASVPTGSSPAPMDDFTLNSIKDYAVALGESFPLKSDTPTIRLLVMPSFDPPHMVTFTKSGEKWHAKTILGTSVYRPAPESRPERQSFVLQRGEQEALEAGLDEAKLAEWAPQLKWPWPPCADGIDYIIESNLPGQSTLAKRQGCDRDERFMRLAHILAAVGHDNRPMD